MWKRIRRAAGHCCWAMHHVMEAPLYLIPRRHRRGWWFDRVAYPVFGGASAWWVRAALRCWGRPVR